MGKALVGFWNKLWSTDSIVSRLVRTMFIALAGAIATGQIELPPWVAAVIAALAGMVPAGQNQSSPATPTAKKSIPPSS